MNLVLLVSLLALSLGQTPAPAAPPPSLTQNRDVLQAVAALTTLPAAEIGKLPATSAIEHDTEVARNDALIIVVTIQNCEKDAAGSCRASADVATYKPDGSVHSETKNVSLTGGRGTAALKLAADDVTGLYRIVATVRDPNARRVAVTERIFGVK